MIYYIQTSGGYVTDVINYPLDNYTQVTYSHALPTGVMGGWYKWDGMSFIFDEERYQQIKSPTDIDLADIKCRTAIINDTTLMTSEDALVLMELLLDIQIKLGGIL